MQEQRPSIRRPSEKKRTPRLEGRPSDLPQRQKNDTGQGLSRTQSFLTKYYEPARGSIQEDARTGHRIFRLKGYTTVDKINRKFQQERNQRTLRSLLTFLMILIFLVILFAIYNPFTNLEEMRKISGDDSFYKKQQESVTQEDMTVGFP
jgi:hypothetical protein